MLCHLAEIRRAVGRSFFFAYEMLAQQQLSSGGGGMSEYSSDVVYVRLSDELD